MPSNSVNRRCRVFFALVLWLFGQGAAAFMSICPHDLAPAAAPACHGHADHGAPDLPEGDPADVEGCPICLTACHLPAFGPSADPLVSVPCIAPRPEVLARTAPPIPDPDLPQRPPRSTAVLA